MKWNPMLLFRVLLWWEIWLTFWGIKDAWTYYQGTGLLISAVLAGVGWQAGSYFRSHPTPFSTPAVVGVMRANAVSIVLAFTPHGEIGFSRVLVGMVFIAVLRDCFPPQWRKGIEQGLAKLRARFTLPWTRGVAGTTL